MQLTLRILPLRRTIRRAIYYETIAGVHHIWYLKCYGSRRRKAAVGKPTSCGVEHLTNFSAVGRFHSALTPTQLVVPLIANPAVSRRSAASATAVGFEKRLLGAAVRRWGLARGAVVAVWVWNRNGRRSQ